MTIKFNPIKTTVAIMALVLLFAECKTVKTPQQTPQQTPKTNYAYHYNPSYNHLNPSYLITKKNNSKINIYLKINTNELKFSNQNVQKKYIANIACKYIIVPSFDDKTVIDSASRISAVKYMKSQNQLVTFFEAKHMQYQDFLVYMKITDLNSGKTSKNFIPVKDINKNPEYNFLFKEKSGKPIFNPFSNLGDTLIVKQNSPHNEIFVNYYKQDFSPSVIPLSNADKIMSDTLSAPSETFTLKVQNRYARFTAKQQGLYIFSNDSDFQTATSMYVADRRFPKYMTPYKLIQPLKYLLSPNEYDMLTNSPNKKLELDKFWFSTTKNISKATQLLKIYYTRIKYANLFFTSYKAGWKTDRGMIYTLFGAPQTLNYDDIGQSWTYTLNNTTRVFRFKTSHRHNAKNDYQLVNKQKHLEIIGKAVENFRNGNIFFKK